jgi:putative transposase
MMIAHKIALEPNHKQRSYFARASGRARFAYNGALGEWKRQYRRGGKPSEVSLRRQLNARKREQYRWMFDVTKCAAQEAIIDLGVAFRALFEKRGAYPRFKKKGVHDSFCAANEVGTFRGDGRRIKLPVVGWLRMREAVRFSGTVKRVTVSREADRWFASLMVETADIQPVVQPPEVVGVEPWHQQACRAVRRCGYQRPEGPYRLAATVAADKPSLLAQATWFPQRRQGEAAAGTAPRTDCQYQKRRDP